MLTRKTILHPDKAIISLQEMVSSSQEILEDYFVKINLETIHLAEIQIRNAAREAAEDIFEIYKTVQSPEAYAIFGDTNFLKSNFAGGRTGNSQAYDYFVLDRVLDKFDSMLEILPKILFPPPRYHLTDLSSCNKSSMVEIDEETIHVSDRLIRSPPNLSLIPIVVIECFGKTSFTRKVCDDPVIQNHFDIIASIAFAVSHNYHAQEMITGLLNSMSYVKCPSHDQNIDQLSKSLYKTLKGRRYLIVMDDVRDTRACDDLKRFIPNDDNGSRILLTTPQHWVAFHAGLRFNIPAYAFPQTNLFSTSKQRSVTKEVSAVPPKGYEREQVEEWQDKGSSKPWDEGVSTAAEEGGKEVGHDENLEISMEMVFLTKSCLNDCILYCSVFPAGYEFTKNMLVWLWMAQGLTRTGDDEEMEETGVQCFDDLLITKQIVPTRYDYYSDQMKYKVSDEMNEILQKQLVGSQTANELDSEQIDAPKLEHFSLAFKVIDHINFGILKSCSHLHTLIIHGCYGSKVKQLPSDLFLELKALKVLCLSHTNLEELPSSIENSKALRYLDMSETPIKWLPESIHCLTNLQTLNLEGCLSLIGLPKCMNKLINLRHLILNVARQLQSMPTGIGKLSNLRTLNTFLVGEDDGCGISELQNMNQLNGSLRILMLENVLTKEEAADASLFTKHHLKKIELQWSDIQDEKNTSEEEILERLLPPFGIQELKILYYSGGMFPSWISNRAFSEMVSITLYKCRYCDSLPSLGELPSLKFLSIVGFDEVLEINSFFCRKQAKQHHQSSFPNLEKLSLDSMSNLKKWTGIENGDFPHLIHLSIEYCPKLVNLPFLSNLNSLLQLEINYCPGLSFLPDGRLPPMLESLMIKDCPKLKDGCCNEQGADWSKIAQVPVFYIDNEKISV